MFSHKDNELSDLASKTLHQTEPKDLYGFSAVAQGLAQSILSLKDDDANVIGIEGTWGSGKTFLVNLLLQHLESQHRKDTHILHISPWLEGNVTSSVESLLLPVSQIINKEEISRLSKDKLQRRAQKEALKKTSETIKHYIGVTARYSLPLAEVASAVPLLGRIGHAVKTLSEIDNAPIKTSIELREEIQNKIAELDLKFIIIIDDLDRLEPLQAVEVLRMVRSVADFSRFRYIMCYDRKVLAHAVEQGLNVTNGTLYLQKIIPLSFSIPRPELFALKRQFYVGAEAIYQEIANEKINKDAIESLNKLSDTYGSVFTTPREVSQVLSSIRFRYSGLRDYVYFPDLCFLLLIRVIHPDLYDWIEHYLTERALAESYDTDISQGDKEYFSERLRVLLDLFPNNSTRKAYKLASWVPGVAGWDKDNLQVFQRVNDSENYSQPVMRRLGSILYWRYYFSYSAPQNVLSENYIQKIITAASGDEGWLKEELLNSINFNNISTRTWFEHIIIRLIPKIVHVEDFKELCGLLLFFLNNNDIIIQRFIDLKLYLNINNLGLNEIVFQIIDAMLKRDRQRTISILKGNIVNGESIFWVSSFIRLLLWDHGLANGRAVIKDEQLFSRDEILSLQEILTKRLDSENMKGKLLDRDGLSTYLTTWQDISGKEVVHQWIRKVCSIDSSFLCLLLRLRSMITSGDKERYYPLYLAKIASFFDDDIDILDRLNNIETQGLYKEQVTKIREAIGISNNF